MADDPLGIAIENMLSYGAVAVLGAGLSMPRYPMTRQLPVLLAHAFDTHPLARAELAAQLGAPDGPTKQLLCLPDAVATAWTVLRAHPQVRAEFQHAAARHDLDRDPLPAHRALARLIAAGTVEWVVSFNWDTALERAHEQQFGIPLPPGVLAKPHGDCTHPDEPWVLPDEDGIVPDDIRVHVDGLVADRPRLLLVVGYSGSDPAVVQYLLDPLRARWPTATISPSATGPEGVAGAAEEVLPLIASELGATGTAPGWLWVTYRHQRDIGAALLGHKLGPQDVEACPSVPAVATAAQHLLVARHAAISGASGCGKSLAAFQAAQILNRDGWGVVELVNQGVATDDDVDTFSELPGPVVAVVDDAQALDSAVRARFERAADDRHAVLLVSTDPSASAANSTIGSAEAVELLSTFCRDQRPDVEPLVSKLDDRVGDSSITQERFVHRVELAARASTPWEFMFTLSGGDLRIAHALGVLGNTPNGQLVLGLLSAAQTLSVDTGVSQDRLRDHGASCGIEPTDVDAAIDALLDARMATSREDQLRTPHLRFAQRAIWTLCRDQAGGHWDPFTRFLRQRVLDETEPLLGRLWLIRDLARLDETRYGPGRIIDQAATTTILDQVLPTPPGRDRGLAAHIVRELDWFHSISDEDNGRIAATLLDWVTHVDGVEIYGVESAFGNLHGRSPEHATRVALALPPELVAQMVAERFDPAAGREWGHLIGRVVEASDIDRDEWTARFAAALDTDLLLGRVAGFDDDVLWSVMEFANDLTQWAPRSAKACIELIGPALVHLVETDLPLAATYLIDWVFGILGAVAFDAAHSDEQPDVPIPDGWFELSDTIVGLVRQIDWESAGRSVARAELRDLDQLDALGFTIPQIDPGLWAQAVGSIDLDHLDRITAGRWEHPEFDRLVETLAHGIDDGVARSWVERHRHEMQVATPAVTSVAPAVAVEVHRRGGSVDLGLDSGPWWDRAARALAALAAVDPGVAREVLDASEPALRDGLLLANPGFTDGVVEFIAALDALDAGLLDGLLGRVDLGVARGHWTDRLDGNEAERAAASALIARAQHL